MINALFMFFGLVNVIDQKFKHKEIQRKKRKDRKG